MEHQKQPIFRFNFKEEIMTMITQFAKIHQTDDRKKYKEEWTAWFNANNLTLEEEIIRLTRIGYIGNVEYKMFNAGRYYFRKKNTATEAGDESKNISDGNNSTSNNSKNVKPPRLYISTDKAILAAMDEHIRNSINTGNFTPAEGYNQFCKLHTHLLGAEIKRMYNVLNSDEIDDKKCATLIIQKIKKTYKNRYFILTHHK